MKRRIVAWILLVLFLTGVSLMAASFFLRRNALFLTGLGFALPVGIAVLIFKVMRPEEEEQAGEDNGDGEGN